MARLSLFAVLAALALAAPARAQIPGTLSYQGYLEQGGAPVSGTRALTFRLYDAPTGGTALWDEAQTAVAVADGVFAVALGAATPLSGLAFDAPYWLGVQVGSEAELAPRTALQSAPYARSAASVALPFAASTGDGTAALSATHTGTVGITIGVAGYTQAPGGYAVFGRALSTSGVNHGVVGRSDSPDGGGMYGVNVAASGQALGGYFLSFSPNGIGVFGETTGETEETYAVYGRSASAAGTGVYGDATSPFGGAGVHGRSAGEFGRGVVGRGRTGVLGQTTSTSAAGGIGVEGVAEGTTGGSVGVRGQSLSPNGIGVYGRNYTPGGRAGLFDGNVHVAGTLSKSAGSFRIDHPLDPENRTLSHSFVESPDMMNVYNGTVTTDARGYATVALPGYFEALNRDFRYQLTTVGSFSRAMVAERVAGNRFVVRTEEPNVEVSWQVTGIRRDAYAERFRIPVEEDKRAEHRGRYLNPAAYGLPRSRGVDYDPALEEAVTATAAGPVRVAPRVVPEAPPAGWDR